MTKPRRSLPTQLLCAFALAACSTPSTPGPSPEPPGPRPGDTSPTAAQTTRSQVLPLANGLTTYLESAPQGSSCEIAFGVLAGSLFMAPGLAELTANVIVRSADSRSGRRSLWQEIAAYGGTIDVRVGLTSTWIDIRVPPGRNRDALVALRAALESMTRSRSQIERIRDQLVAAICEQTQRDIVGATAESLLHAQPGTGPHLESMLDLDASQVGVFASRMYRPERCVLAMRSPGRLDKLLEKVREPAERSIAAWRPGPPIPGSSELLDRRFESGLYWHEPETPTRETQIALVLQLPEPGTPLTGPLLVMHSCLTLDGRGGRLERLQAEAGLEHLQWRARLLQTTDVSALVLESSGSSEDAVAMWRVLHGARRSLVEVPPTESELRQALRGATLLVRLGQLDPFSRLWRSVVMAAKGMSWTTSQNQLRVMADLSQWDSAAAARSYQETPVWMIAIGTGRPEHLPGLRTFEPFPKGFDPKAPGEPTPEILASAEPWLAAARAAAGGDQIIARLHGFTAETRTDAKGAPSATDRLQWSDDGTLQRKRTVLGTEIETELRGAKCLERLDGTTKSLDQRAAESIRREMRRHPLMLLSAHRRGALKFRPVAQRSIGDREFMVLEAVGDTFERLRIYIDVESHLIRTVESWERTVDDTLVHIQENWSDYRNAGGLRAPHRRRTTWDDGLHQSETVFTAWQPLLDE